MTRLTLLFLIAAFAAPRRRVRRSRAADRNVALNAHGVDEAAADAKARAIETY